MIAPHNNHRTVLIADADESESGAHANLLRRQFYDVSTVKDGLECVAYMRERLPTVLVLNRELTWGGSDGVIAILRETYKTHPIPVVLTTNKMPCDSFPRLTVPPIVRCLRKPYGFQALLDAIRAASTFSASSHRLPRMSPWLRDYSMR